MVGICEVEGEQRTNVMLLSVQLPHLPLVKRVPENTQKRLSILGVAKVW